MCSIGNKTWTDCRGMTLVELMVAIGVTMLVMSLTTTIFVGQYQSYEKRRASNEIQETLPAIVEVLKRDLMEAGWSVKPEMAFYIQDGGTTGTDRIFVNDTSIIDTTSLTDITSFLEDPDECSGASQFLGQNTTSLSMGRPDIDNDGTVDFSPSDANAFHYAISDSLTNKIAQIITVSDDGTNVTVDRALSGTFAAPAIYYCVDDGSSAACHPSGKPSQWVLRRSDRNSGGSMAENVVDLQLAYMSKAGVWYGTSGCEERGDCAPASFNPAEIEFIRFTLVTRVSRQRASLKDNPMYCRPAVENRTAAATGSEDCGYTYRTYTIQVIPRNT